ncbi:aspartate-tRNA(Asn) ligase [Cryptococcus depauperatus]|nr:aspartate-tRNA(Asn) ligase [Cryptococcus depauperatus CBS 7855]
MTTEPTQPSNPLTKLGQAIKSRLPNGKQEQEDDNGSDHDQIQIEREQRKQQEMQEQKEKQMRLQREAEELRQRRLEADLRAQQEDDPETRASYGKLEDLEEITPLEDIVQLPAGIRVTTRVRIHTQRDISSYINFVILRHRGYLIQGLLPDGTSEHMIKWVQHLPDESIVQVTGTLQNPPQPITSNVDTPLEIIIESIHLVEASYDIPFSLSRGFRPPQNTRLNNRTLDLRHPTNQAIFKIRSKVLKVFRDTLENLSFLEINTPKLQPAATESGAEVFRVNYFGRKAFLAQSPQLMKQMAISADFGRVYEIGPVFRAENSNTHRHLTEYTGLDIEMLIEKDYHEVFQVVDIVLKNIFKTLTNMKTELGRVLEHFLYEDLQWLDETLILPFHEAIQMLRDDGRDVEEEDLSTPDEIRLGQIIKEKYKTDYYAIDRFPISARPFYTANDGEATNSFDLFIRGQEICTGGQRINDPEKLRQSMYNSGIDPREMQEYLSAFDWGMPPHGGAGLGLERIVTFFLNLPDVRLATLYHRDPHSLPVSPVYLPHPEADTTKPTDPSNPPPVEMLIANYGDAANTSWLDDRFEIWHDEETGAAVGYSKQDSKFCMITGDPLCAEKQKKEVTKRFIDFVQRVIKLRPVWMLVSETMEEILVEEHGWRALSCTQEQRSDSDKADLSLIHNSKQKKGVFKVREIEPKEDIIKRIDDRIEDWKSGRNEKGKQIRLTEVAPWKDMEHRRYFIAESHHEEDQIIKEDDSSAKIKGNPSIDTLVVLTRLAPSKGYQLKWALDFPGAPHDAIECTVQAALSAVPGEPVTFGTAVSERLVQKHGISETRARFMEKTYKGIVKSLALDKKAGFREKFGVTGDLTYICYPKGGVKPYELKDIVKFFE